MKKLTTLALGLVMASAMMVGCAPKDADIETSEDVSEAVTGELTEDVPEEVPLGEPVADIAMGNTFEATITEISTETEVTMATVVPVEGEEILSYGEYANVGLIKDHGYEIGDIVTVAYGKAFSENDKIEFDNVTIEW